MSVDEGAECQAVAPAARQTDKKSECLRWRNFFPKFYLFIFEFDMPEMEVLHVDILVRGGLSLAPQQETFLRCHFLHGDVLFEKH